MTVCTKSFEIIRSVVTTIFIAMVNDEMTYVLISALFATELSFSLDRAQKTFDLITLGAGRCFTWSSSRFSEALNTAKVLFSSSRVAFREHGAAESAFVFPLDGTYASRPFAATFDRTECLVVAPFFRKHASTLLAFKVLVFSLCDTAASYSAKLRRYPTPAIFSQELLPTRLAFADWLSVFEPCRPARLRTPFCPRPAFPAGEFFLAPRAHIASVHRDFLPSLRASNSLGR